MALLPVFGWGGIEPVSSPVCHIKAQKQMWGLTIIKENHLIYSLGIEGVITGWVWVSSYLLQDQRRIGQAKKVTSGSKSSFILGSKGPV